MKKPWMTILIDDYTRQVLAASIQQHRGIPLALLNDDGQAHRSRPIEASAQPTQATSGKAAERGRVGRVSRKGWRADPAWLRELEGLMAVYEDHCAYLGHHAEEEAAGRLGLTPGSVRKRFTTELKIQDVEFAEFRLSLAEVEEAVATADLTAAYEPWKDRVPMGVFIGAMAEFRNDPDLGVGVIALFDRCGARINACEKCREWHARKRSQ
jgi:hypothetical protein